MDGSAREASGPRIHLTGGTGFLGRHVVSAVVRAGGSVSALLRGQGTPSWAADAIPDAKVVTHAGDLLDPPSLEDWLEGAEIVLHAAAHAVVGSPEESPRAFYDTNFGGTLNLLEACRARGVRRLVFLSTAHVYGRPLYQPVDEAHPLLGTHPYAASKIAAETAVRSYGATCALQTVILRPSNLYGPRQTLAAVIPTIVDQALRGEVAPRSLTPVRDFVYVEDAAQAVLQAATSERAAASVLNLSSGRGAAVADLARIVIALMRAELGDQRDIAVRARSHEAGRDEIVCSNLAAREILGWNPETSLEEGLRRTLAAAAQETGHAGSA